MAAARRALLGAIAVLPGAALVIASAPAAVAATASLASPDAGLLALCASIPVHNAAYLAAPEWTGRPGAAGDPWLPLSLAERAIIDTPACTLEGILAKARTAHLIANDYQSATLGAGDPDHCPAGNISWSVVQDLLRIGGVH